MELIQNKELGERQKTVYRVFKRFGAMTNLQVSRKLLLPINSITPRTNELVKMGLIEEKRRDLCPISKRKAIFWGVL